MRPFQFVGGAGPLVVAYPADVLQPAKVDEISTGILLAGLAGRSIVSVHLGARVHEIQPAPPGIFMGSVLYEKDGSAGPDFAALTELGSLSASVRYLQALGHDSDENLDWLTGNHKGALEKALVDATKSRDELLVEADLIVQRHWPRILRLMQDLAYAAGSHGPIEAF
ncbi:hypothetical protein M1L60_32825 [Actinoplanes sp. TRM 88003]|uniref:Uncharacterized protein n=1 Tax=Paractinoplanes aksuensis TaxID=2939490 RepID=A0ABT1DX30_9ACTN|nr:hypothetical protein [Actinoplanes aksuensis]MCO8275378.1 hypothetical protein [Actinoplanes aksuensis]